MLVSIVKFLFNDSVKVQDFLKVGFLLLLIFDKYDNYLKLISGLASSFFLFFSSSTTPVFVSKSIDFF
jgi:hypothetical protein